MAVLSTYVPRRCGIATFARDLVEGIVASSAPTPRTAAGSVPFRVAGAPDVRVIAVEDHPAGIRYSPPVARTFASADRAAYRRLARDLEAEGAEVLSLQHEYGIYGGPSGAYVIDLLEAASIPVVATLHTILARPTPLQEGILRAIGARCARVVAMSERGRSILVERYGLEPAKVEVIPHGVPAFDHDAAGARTRLGLGDEKVILSLGLLGPHKSIDLVLEALARVAPRTPDVVYAVVGATHPEIVRHSGEAYREGLVALAARLGLSGRVRFVDRYVDDRELADWLVASDIFVAPYPNAEQITSGTLAYALAAGAAVVSTPFEHAVELLSDGKGVLFPFGDVVALAASLERLLTDDAWREGVRQRGREHGRSATWTRVGARYARLLAAVAQRDALPGAIGRGLPGPTLRVRPARAGAVGDVVGPRQGSARRVPMRPAVAAGEGS